MLAGYNNLSQVNVDVATNPEQPHHDWLRGPQRAVSRIISATHKKCQMTSWKIALWYQIDRRIDLLINLQLSTQIPMVKTTN